MKYKKVIGSWTYGHIVIPEKLIYIGSSSDKYVSLRFQPTKYKETSLQPYIEKHGWDNIKHIVFKDGLTKEQAKQLEGLLIKQAIIDGWCINKNESYGVFSKAELNKLNRKYHSTPEWKIYDRVHSFNRYHPDRITETPLEAKNKYIEYGYIPTYIKSDDLV